MRSHWLTHPLPLALPLPCPGPRLFSDIVLQELGLTPESRPVGEYRSAAMGKVVVYPLGEWYIPCRLSDKPCANNVSILRGLGTYPLDRVAGMHRYSLSWLGYGIRRETMMLNATWVEVGVF